MNTADKKWKKSMATTNYRIRYYKVICLGGHKGGSNIGELCFGLKAYNIMEVYDKARQMPCVKHTKVNAIQSVVEITKEEYKELKENNIYSRYFNH